MRILVLRLSSLGDVILTQSVVAELRQLYPGAQIDYICKPEYSPIVCLFGLDLRVLEFARSLSWHQKLRREQYDIVVDLHAKFSTWLIRTLVRAKLKVTYDKQRRLRQSIVRGAKEASIESTVRLYYSALEKLLPEQFNSRTAIRYPRLSLSVSSDQAQAIPKQDPGKKLIGLFVGAAHLTKAYPVKLWKDFIRLTGDKYEFRLYGNQADGVPGKAIVREFGQVTDLCGKLDLVQLAGEVKHCDAIISGDSGPMHLAAALSKPQIAIFGSTHPRLGFAPLNDKARILSLDLDCQPCSLHGLERCPRGHFNCMKQITPALLAQTLEELLSS